MPMPSSSAYRKEERDGMTPVLPRIEELEEIKFTESEILQTSSYLTKSMEKNLPKRSSEDLQE